MIAHSQRQNLTYEELDSQSNALARGLQKLGVRKGDRVAVKLGNGIEYALVCVCSGLACFDAIWSRGAAHFALALTWTYMVIRY